MKSRIFMHENPLPLSAAVSQILGPGGGKSEICSVRARRGRMVQKKKDGGKTNSLHRLLGAALLCPLQLVPKLVG